MFRFLFLFLLLPFVTPFYSNILKHNYENFFKEKIDFDPISENIQLYSPFSPIIRGKEQYKIFFNTLQFISNKALLVKNVEVIHTKETIEMFEIVWQFQGLSKAIIPVTIKGASFYTKDNNGMLNSHNITMNINPDLSFYKKEKVNDIIIDYMNPSVSFFSHNCTIQKCLDKIFKDNDDNNNYPHPLLKRPIRVRVDE
jgi:hypothetical protein